jgi:subtilisin family serine protease
MASLSETVDWSVKVVRTEETGVNGAGVKVGILDSGCAANHPDLKDGIVSFKDFTGSSLDDKDGHGTHTAGIIGARANDIGVVGVAPECSLYVYKVLSDSGWGDYDWVANAVSAAAADGCNIINMSFGCNDLPPDNVHQAIKDARAAGSLVFAAAGNDGRGLPPTADAVDYPARWEEVVAVAAVGQQHNHADFSSPGPGVAIAAPGTDIYSTWPTNSYSLLSGTSMACPVVSGVAALYWESLRDTKPNNMTMAEFVWDNMRADAMDLGAPGRDPLFGYGLVQFKAN